MAEYPLLFRITHSVRSDAFEALLVADGRALMAFEDGEWWCHGVEPGGMTENGAGPLVAFERFLLTFRHALDDLAEECGSYEEFQRDARMLFSTDAADESRWNGALAALRDGMEIEEPFRDMQRIRPRPSVLTIEKLLSFANAPMKRADVSDAPALPLAA